MIQVILTDDHSIIRDGIRSLLSNETSMQIVGEAASGQALLELLKTGIEANVILLDIQMPEMNGFEVVSHLAKHRPDLRILMLSMVKDEKVVLQLLEAGAHGYLLKTTKRMELVYAIQLVAAGGIYIGADISATLLNQYCQASLAPTEESVPSPSQAPISAKVPTIDNLSSREVEVLKLIGEGLTNAEIADKLFVSKRTVDAHRQKVIEKTHVKNTAALIRYALEKGLID